MAILDKIHVAYATRRQCRLSVEYNFVLRHEHPWAGQRSCPNDLHVSRPRAAKAIAHHTSLKHAHLIKISHQNVCTKYQMYYNVSIGSYETALVVCHCWRSDMIRPKASLISSKASCSRNRMTLMGSRYNSIVAITGSS